MLIKMAGFLTLSMDMNSARDDIHALHEGQNNASQVFMLMKIDMELLELGLLIHFINKTVRLSLNGFSRAQWLY